MITFAICGVWHGEGWTYLTWGLLFGFYLTYANWTEKVSKNIRKRFHIKKTATLYIIYKVTMTFLLVSFAWIFFRANSLTEALLIIKRIFTTAGMPFYESPANLIYSIFGILVLLFADFKQEYFRSSILLLYNRHSYIRIGTIVSMIVVILLIGVYDGGQFIYFQF